MSPPYYVPSLVDARDPCDGQTLDTLTFTIGPLRQTGGRTLADYGRTLQTLLMDIQTDDAINSSTAGQRPGYSSKSSASRACYGVTRLSTCALVPACGILPRYPTTIYNMIRYHPCPVTGCRIEAPSPESRKHPPCSER